MLGFVESLWRPSRAPESKKMVRYIMVSFLTTFLGFALLGLVFGVLHLWSETPSAIVTSVVATVPAYYMNRSYVWQKSGRSRWTREVLPFWAVSVAGILVTVAAAAVSHHISTTDHFTHLQATALLLTVTLTAAGGLWIFKYLVFNRLFVQPPLETSDPNHPVVN
jgi:putative flippase GtrA